MEVMTAAKSGSLLCALRVLPRRKVSACRGRDYNEVSQAIKKESRARASFCLNKALASDMAILQDTVRFIGAVRYGRG